MSIEKKEAGADSVEVLGQNELPWSIEHIRMERGRSDWELHYYGEFVSAGLGLGPAAKIKDFLNARARELKPCQLCGFWREVGDAVTRRWDQEKARSLPSVTKEQPEKGDLEEKEAVTRNTAVLAITAAITRHIDKRAETWRTNTEDPHGINTAVYVSLREVSEALKDFKANSVPSA